MFETSLLLKATSSTSRCVVYMADLMKAAGRQYHGKGRILGMTRRRTLIEVSKDYPVLRLKTTSRVRSSGFFLL